jgi:hypothetical protein
LRLIGAVFGSESEDTSLYCNLKDTSVKYGLPGIMDSDMLIGFKRMKWLKEKEYNDFISKNNL